MKKAGRSARQLELAAAAAGPARIRRSPLPSGEAMAMLVRRHLRPAMTQPEVPFPAGLPEEAAGALADRLGHYAFRLFLRGAIQRSGGRGAEERRRPDPCGSRRTG